MNSSLLFRLAKYAINNPIIHTFYSHIFWKKEKLFATVWRRCNHSSKDHFRTMSMRLQYKLHHTQYRRTLKLGSSCFEKEKWSIEWVEFTQTYLAQYYVLFHIPKWFLFFFFLLKMTFPLQSGEENHCDKPRQRVPVILEIIFCGKQQHTVPQCLHSPSTLGT